MTESKLGDASWWSTRSGIVLLCLVATGLALIVVDHWAHMLGIWPYLLLLACPLLHLVMHGRHGHGEHHRHGAKSARPGGTDR